MKNVKSALTSASILTFLMLAGYTSVAQTTAQKIGTNPTIKNASALLELEATNKGVLMPRVSLTSTADNTTVPSSANALTVFNTATAGDVTPGYYYWDLPNLKWVRLLDTKTGWQLLGNTGTTSALNFVGTTDAQDLAFRTKNLERLRVTQTGRLDLSNTSGSGSNIFVDGGNELVTGVYNTAMGVFALINITSGDQNTAIGGQALQSNKTGSNNVAIGERALQTATSGYNNTAVGLMTGLDLTTGNANALFGAQAGMALKTGSNNVFIGNGAGSLITTGRNNIALGTSVTLPSISSDYQLNIGNAIFGTGLSGSISAPAGSIGINTVAPNSTLQVAGSFSTPFRTVTGDTNITDKDHTVALTAQGPALFTLPDPTTCSGRIYRFINYVGNGNGGSDEINFNIGIYYYNGTVMVLGNAIWSIANNFITSGTTGMSTSLTIQSDGTNWYAVGL